MDKFQKLENEFFTLNKRIVEYAPKKFLSANDVNNQRLLELFNSLESLQAHRVKIFSAIISGLMMVIPYILHKRIEFNYGLIRVTIGIREIIEESKGEFEEIGKLELNDYVSESYITVAHLASSQYVNGLFDVENSLKWMEHAFFSIATELDCLKI